jgi:YfiH family protein
MHPLSYKLNGNDPIIAYQFDGLRACAETSHAIFTRRGGVSRGAFASLNLSLSVKDDVDAVTENNRRVFAALGYRREEGVTAWLVHGRAVALVTRADAGRRPAQVDALITRERGLPLRMCYGDCAPILFYDPQQQALGLAHAGWRGAALNVAAATVQAMVDAFGSDAHHLWAGIGPAISLEHYEVGQDVVDQVAAACPRGARLTQPGNQGRLHLDLTEAVRSQLQAAGVGAIELSGLCTASNTHEWFSHRAEQGKTGRFGIVVALNP